MNVVKKGFLVLALTVCSVIISTNVNAIDITKRILSDNNLLLGASVDSSYSTETITTNTKDIEEEVEQDTLWGKCWKAWLNNESVEITWDELKNTPELLCIESEAGLPSGIKIKYYKKEGPIKFGDGEYEYGAIEDYTIAYILSEEINEDQNGNELYEQDIQGALWRTKFNMDKEHLSVDNLAGEELYNIATKYAEYRDGYKDPQFIDAGELKTVNSSDSKIVGPLKIKYNMSYLSKDNKTVLFGNIKEAILKDSNGKQYTHKTDWWFVDKDKKEISNSLGDNYTYNYPLSGQVFYIKIRAGLNITKANLSFEFNNITAHAEAMILEGSYKVPAKTEETLHLCSSCNDKLKKAMAEVECGDSLYNGSAKHTGYKITKSSNKAFKCGTYYDQCVGELPEDFSSPSLRARAKATAYTWIIVDVDGVEHITQSNETTCMSTYIQRYDTEYPTYTDFQTKPNVIAYCGGSSCAGKNAYPTIYTFSKCKNNGGKEYCTTCQAAYDTIKDDLRLWKINRFIY